MSRALIDTLRDSERTGRDERGVGRVGRLLCTWVCPTGSCAFFLFLLILIIPASLLRVALPRLLIMRYGPRAGPFRRDHAREPLSRELILKLVSRSRRLRHGTLAKFFPTRCHVNFHRFTHTRISEYNRCASSKRFSRNSRMRFHEERGRFIVTARSTAEIPEIWAYKPIISILCWLTAFRPWVTGQRTHWWMTNGRSVCATVGKEEGGYCIPRRCVSRMRDSNATHRRSYNRTPKYMIFCEGVKTSKVQDRILIYRLIA